MNLHDGIDIRITGRKRVEEAAALLAAIVTSSSDAIISKALDGTVTTWNEAAAHLFGYSEEEMAGQPIRRLIPEHLQNEEGSILARIAAGGPIQNYETLRLHKDGRSIEVSVTISPIRDAAGKVIGASKIVRDITERKQAEAILKHTAAQFHTLADGIPTLCWMAEPDGHIFWYNKRWYDYTGTTPEEMKGWGWQSVHHPEVLPEVLARWRASLATGTPFEMTFPLRGADGLFRPFLTRIVPDLGPDGRVRRWLGTNTDVTEERRIRAALEQSEARLRMSQEVARVGSWEWDLVTNKVHWSELQCRRFGIDPAIGGSVDFETWRKAVHPGDLIAVEEHLRLLIENGDYSDVEYRIHGPDGLRWLYARAHVIRDPEGKALRLIGIDMDITGRKEAEAALRESQQRHEALIRSAMDAIIVIDAGQRIILFNPAAERMFGWPASEALGCLIDRFIPRQYRQAHRDHIATFGATGTTTRQMGALGSVRGLRQNGKEFPIEASISQLQVGGEKLFTVILRDITERKRHEERDQLLVHEVNHRAKNMLAVVQSIARQTVATKPDDFISRFGERIQALSRNQDLLIQNEWSGVDLAALVHSQFGHFQDAIGSRIELKGPSLLISPAAAQTIGMALHELCTNASKYGALLNRDGRLEIGWSLERTGGNEEAFAMFWREQGGPPVIPPAKRGFGSTVISRLLIESLDADVDLDFAVSGLTWRLRCPAKEVIQGQDFLPASKE